MSCFYVVSDVLRLSYMRHVPRTFREKLCCPSRSTKCPSSVLTLRVRRGAATDVGKSTQQASQKPIPSRSFNKARDRSLGRSTTRHLLRRRTPPKHARARASTIPWNEQGNQKAISYSAREGGEGRRRKRGGGRTAAPDRYLSDLEA